MDPGLRRLALQTLLAAFPGQTAPDWTTRLIADGLAGFTLFGYNIVSQKQLAALTAQLHAARPGVLLAIGAELNQLGLNLNLAPTDDVNTADDNPIIGTRSFGPSPSRVAAHAAAAVAGLQDLRVAACAKHFPGHGATVVDSHFELPTVDVALDVLRERDLPPFAAVVKADAKAIMTAHIRVPAVTGGAPATFSRAALTELLRGELGFTGVVVTDALEMLGAAA